MLVSRLFVLVQILDSARTDGGGTDNARTYGGGTDSARRDA